jgi:hypothetical protein
VVYLRSSPSSHSKSRPTLKIIAVFYKFSPPATYIPISFDNLYTQVPEAALLDTLKLKIAQRLSWFGLLHRMPEERMVKRVYKWKPMLTRPLGRPKNRWEDDIINDTKETENKELD